MHSTHFTTHICVAVGNTGRQHTVSFGDKKTLEGTFNFSGVHSQVYHTFPKSGPVLHLLETSTNGPKGHL